MSFLTCKFQWTWEESDLRQLNVTGYKWSIGLIPLLLSIHWISCTASVLLLDLCSGWTSSCVTYLFLIAGMLRRTCRHLLKKWNNFIVHARKERNHPFQCTWCICFPFFFLNFLKESNDTEQQFCTWEVREKAGGNLCCWHSVTVQWGMFYHLSDASSLGSALKNLTAWKRGLQPFVVRVQHWVAQNKQSVWLPTLSAGALVHHHGAQNLLEQSVVWGLVYYVSHQDKCFIVLQEKGGLLALLQLSHCQLCLHFERFPVCFVCF